MLLTCSRNALTSAFSAASGVVPARTTKAILKSIKLQAASGAVTLLGTDSEVSLRCTIPDVAIDAGGETLLPASRLLAILREMSDESVTLEATADAVWVRGAHSEFKLPAEDPAEFPPVAQFEDDSYFTLPAAAFRQLIRRTVFATDVESTRYALGGILVELGPERATLAATDSRRLSVAQSACQMVGNPEPVTPPPVVPAKAMSLIERILGDQTEDVKIAIHPNDIVVQAGTVMVSSQLVQGRFPDYRKVIPTTFASTIDMVVGPFYQAVRQAQILTNEESRGVDFTFDEGTLQLSSQAADMGQSNIELPIAYTGPRLQVTFDPRFVADFLKSLDSSSQVQLKLIDEDSAAVLATDDDYTYVIMPLSRDR